MSSRVPSPRELEVLRYLAAGMRIAPVDPQTGRHAVIAKGVTVITILRDTCHALFACGWTRVGIDGWRISMAGRDVVDVKAFVRHFADEAQR